VDTLCGQETFQADYFQLSRAGRTKGKDTGLRLVQTTHRRLLLSAGYSHRQANRGVAKEASFEAWWAENINAIAKLLKIFINRYNKKIK